jgi:hypothetical protein
MGSLLDTATSYSHWDPRDIDDNGTQLADPAELDLSSPCPPAPKLQDMDSFTDGTGVGSFDFSLYSSQEDLSSPSQLNIIPDPASKTFQPEPPLRSIENWRDTVLTASGIETQGVAVACEHEIYGTPGPRGLKRHLSLIQSDGEDRYDRGAERARGRWAASMAQHVGNYDYAFLDEAPHAECDDTDDLYYRSDDEEAGCVWDETNIPLRPASAPPDL